MTAAPYPSSSINGQERAAAGVTVTAREQRTGRQRVVHHPGLFYRGYERTTGRRRNVVGATATDALRAACADIDAWDGDWKIVCISTPQSILRDMRNHGAAVPVTHTTHDTRRRRIGREAYEENLLRRVGRMDLYGGSVDGI